LIVDIWRAKATLIPISLFLNPQKKPYV